MSRQLNQGVIISLSIAVLGLTAAPSHGYELFERIALNSKRCCCLDDVCAEPAACAEGCGSQSCCDDPFPPNMIGSGGLSMPKVFRPLIGGPFVFKHRHVSNVSDNNSPIPRDRVFYSYDLYNQAILLETLGMGHNDGSIKSHRFGIEKTIFDGRASLELIVPFHHTTDSNVNVSVPQSPLTDTEFGQLAFGAKMLLRQTDNATLSAGLRVEAPTDENFGDSRFSYLTEAYYFTPYLAYVCSNESWFFQSFVSYRMRDRNMFLLDNGVINPNAQSARDPDLLSVDASVGRWWYRCPNARFLTGLSSSLEIHYQGQYEGEAFPIFQSVVYGDHIDNLSLTIGLTAVIGQDTTLTAGYVAPLRMNTIAPTGGVLNGFVSPTDRYAEGTFLIQVNHYFGRK